MSAAAVVAALNASSGAEARAGALGVPSRVGVERGADGTAAGVFNSSSRLESTADQLFAVESSLTTVHGLGSGQGREASRARGCSKMARSSSEEGAHYVRNNAGAAIDHAADSNNNNNNATGLNKSAEVGVAGAAAEGSLGHQGNNAQVEKQASPQHTFGQDGVPSLLVDPDTEYTLQGNAKGSNNNVAGDKSKGVDPEDTSLEECDASSVSSGMLLYNLDCGTLEPPSPEPPSPDLQGGPRGGDSDSGGGEQRRGRRRRREKRTMTSLYVR